MSDLNMALVSGRLTRDPELRYTPNGTAVCDLSVACNRRFRKGDDWKEEVAFIGVRLWSKGAEWAGRALSKGTPVLVHGRLTYEEWDAKEGTGKRSRLLLTSYDIKKLAPPAPAASDGQEGPAREPDDGAGLNDEVPF